MSEHEYPLSGPEAFTAMTRDGATVARADAFNGDKGDMEWHWRKRGDILESRCSIKSFEDDWDDAPSNWRTMDPNEGRGWTRYDVLAKWRVVPKEEAAVSEDVDLTEIFSPIAISTWPCLPLGATDMGDPLAVGIANLRPGDDFRPALLSLLARVRDSVEAARDRDGIVSTKEASGDTGRGWQGHGGLYE